MSQVLEVLPDFFKQYPEAIEKLRLHVYGCQLDPKSKQWIQNSKYKANLIEHGRVENDLISGLTGRQQIEKRMREADVLLLLHGDTEWCREYIPSKLYDYLWTNRPIWGLIYKNEMLCNVRNTFEKFNLISGLHSFMSDENKIYENVLPPVSILNEKDKLLLIEELNKLNFTLGSLKVA